MRIVIDTNEIVSYVTTNAQAASSYVQDAYVEHNVEERAIAAYEDTKQFATKTVDQATSWVKGLFA